MSKILEYTRINEYLLHKEKTCSASKGVWPYATIKTQRPSRKRYAQFLKSSYSLTLLELSSNLTFGGSLAGTTLVLSVRSFSVLGRSGVERVGTVWLTSDFFGIISWRRLWEIRVISHCFIPETKGRTVQTRSMASANQETGNPLTVVEWQLQTLLAAIERLTQKNKALMLQNQALEVQIKHPQEHQVLSHDQRRSGHNHYPPLRNITEGNIK